MDEFLDCKGCKAYCDVHYSKKMLSITKKSLSDFKKKCPCSRCIVKIMCKTICYKFVRYVTGGKKPPNTVVSRYIVIDGWAFFAYWNYEDKGPITLGGLRHREKSDE